MISPNHESNRKAEANRQNAIKSTGPRTLRGKRTVRNNALTHGFYAVEAVLPGEYREDFEGLMRGLWQEWQPETETQKTLVNGFAATIWKLRRLDRMEDGIVGTTMHRIRGQRIRALRRGFERLNPELAPAVGELVQITDKAEHDALTEKWMDEVLLEESEKWLAGPVFAEASVHLEKLSRWRAELERSYYRALHELQRQKAARQGSPVEPPAAVDVNLAVCRD